MMTNFRKAMQSAYRGCGPASAQASEGNGARLFTPKGWKERAARLRERLARKWPFDRLLEPRCLSGRGDDPGLVMLKIDGLSHRQMQRALKNKRLPHLARLIREGRYSLKPFYSGIPSSTPVVQGELFFGIRTSVPAITFYDRQQDKKVNMLLPASVETWSRKLQADGRPLLQGGRSYSNIYVGGAEEARYCIQTMRLRSLRQVASSVKLVLALTLQPLKLLQMLGYGLLETALAFTDFFGGVLEGRNIVKELKFVPTRVLVCIFLRELIRIRVKMDVSRGVPIVHASFLGYDEQAHRRGPGSAFAHWSLKGIDDVIREIHRTAARSPCRRYRLVVYSDHGQEATLPYEAQSGMSLETAVERALRAAEGGNGTHRNGRRDAGGGMRARRARSLLWTGSPKGGGAGVTTNGKDLAGATHITALGPLGHIYLAGKPDAVQKGRIAENLARDGKIPLVLYDTGERVVALNPRGRFDLATEAEAVLGAAHPFAEQAARDLAATCRHPQAGDLVISGWVPEGPAVTFAVENGAHGGPGRDETRAFVVLPEVMNPAAEVLRPSDLRDQVLAFRETEGTDPG
jgi:hypothetical protein